MTKRRRRGTVRYIGDLIEDTFDRASDVERDLRRAARTAVGNRDDDDWDDDRDDRDRRSDDELDEILDDLGEVCRKLRRYETRDRRSGDSRGRPPGRDAAEAVRDVREIAGSIADLNRRVDVLSRQLRSQRSDDEPE
ncbi:MULTISPECIES: hypothetical protein [Actinomadura]|uniref:Uncharacterized protein n=1 Tax=Actinomadura yumaensis TaxID=111807 RepID=A0ABW2CQF3_9ACTN|nr:hypothetical protein [Actinomadura sp. J1-007]MWK37348.1 hypothetical protein [Actinomadura sp. J1-007]